MKTPKSVRWSAFALLLASTAGSLNVAAQTAPSPTAPSVDDTKEAIILSPFTVSADQDVGYQATNTLVGGRIQTSIDKTPAAVNILTREFLDDIGANNFTQAAAWATNAMVPSTTSDYSEYLVNFRGLGAGNVTQNYFVWAMQSDSYSTERLEFARGPNSILFGSGNLAGIPTTFTKQAKFTDFTEVIYRVDTNGTNRVTLDENFRLLKGNAALRVALLEQDGERWRKPSRDDRQGIYLAGTYRINASTSFRFDAEYGQYKRSLGDQNFIDALSLWNATLYSGTGTTTIPTTGTGLAVVGGTSDYLVYNAGQDSAGVMNYRGFYQTTGSGLTILPDPRPGIANSPGLPSRDFDIQPPNNLLLGNYAFGTGYLEKRFGENLFFQLAFNRMYVDRSRRGGTFATNVRRDPNQFLPNGTPNPNVGKAYVDAQVAQQRQWSYGSNYQLLGSYRLANNWTEQRFSLLSTFTDSLWRLTNKRLVRLNNPSVTSLTNGTNFVYERIYLDRPVNAPYSELLAGSNGYAIGYHRNNMSSVASRSFNTQIAAVGSYFDGKLNSVFGVRRDNGKRTNESASVAADNTLTVLPSSIKDNYTTKSAGLVYFPIKQIGPFINYSDNYAPQGNGAPLFSGREPEAATGKTKEVGFHFKLLNESIQGAFRYYDTKQDGRVIAVPGSTNINNIWSAMNQAGRQLSPVPRDTQSQAGHGIELEGTANLSKSWRIYGNFAKAKSSQTDSIPGTLGYYNANLAEWQAAAATNTTVASNLQSLQSAIQSVADGRELNATPKFTANLYATYTFNNWNLKGLSLAGGTRVIGRQLIGNVFNQPYNYIYQDQRYLVDANIAYNGKLGRLRYKVQLNVFNVLDDDTLIFNNVSRPSGFTTDMYNGYIFTEPRRYQLTLVFRY